MRHLFTAKSKVVIKMGVTLLTASVSSLAVANAQSTDLEAAVERVDQNLLDREDAEKTARLIDQMSKCKTKSDIQNSSPQNDDKYECTKPTTPNAP